MDMAAAQPSLVQPTVADSLGPTVTMLGQRIAWRSVLMQLGSRGLTAVADTLTPHIPSQVFRLRGDINIKMSNRYDK